MEHENDLALQQKTEELSFEDTIQTKQGMSLPDMYDLLTVLF